MGFDYRAEEFPSIRIAEAIGSGTNKSLLFVIGGGLGDKACAEPTLRYAFQNFKDCSISLLCDTPELFEHYIFANVYRHHSDVPPKTHLALHTYQQGLFNEFVSANGVHPVDFASISALRMVLPDRRIISSSFFYDELGFLWLKRMVVLHVGESWPSRTFPDAWWNELIELIELSGLPVVLIGNRKTPLKIDRENSKDFTNQTKLDAFISICQFAELLVTNDSSPVHLTSRNTISIIIPTVKNPDLLRHEDRNQIFLNGAKMWSLFDWCPNTLDDKDLTQVPLTMSILDFLPTPMEVATCVSKNWRKNERKYPVLDAELQSISDGYYDDCSVVVRGHEEDGEID